MLTHSQKSLIKGLVNQVEYGFAGLSKRKPTRKDLDKYDVIWIGGNLGGICSRHFDHVAKGKYSMMAVFDQNINQQYPMRTIYEQQRATKTDYLPNAKLAINMYTAHSDNIGVQQFLPNENAIVLRNGRRIEYEQLVVAMGMQHDINAIENFEEAWKDEMHPFYTNKDHPSWRADNHKYARYHYNYTHGDAIFCIPPYPFAGEVECYNFFISQQIWSWYKAHGKLSPINSFTVVNANEKFVQYMDSADTFIKEELAKRGVKIEYGLNLTGVNKEQQIATFTNLKTGKKEQRPYNNLYTIFPCKPHESLVNAGLTAPNGLLDVNIKTLQHNKYNNIFGLGDVANLPTTKTFWGGFYQVHVVRNNLLRNLQGQTLNAQYDGFSKVPLITGQADLTYVAHYYDNVAAQQHLMHKSGGPLSRIRYLYWGKPQRKKFLGYYLFKTWGPPYHKLKQTFSELPGSPESSQGSGLSKYMPSKKSTPEAAQQNTQTQPPKENIESLDKSKVAAKADLAAETPKPTKA